MWTMTFMFSQILGPMTNDPFVECGPFTASFGSNDQMTMGTGIWNEPWSFLPKYEEKSDDLCL